MSAADIVAIQQVLARLTRIGDFGELNRIAECYTDDAFFEVTGLPTELAADGRIDGAAALQEMYAGLFAANRGHARHWVGNTVVDLVGADEARTSSYFVIVRAGQTPLAGLLLTGTYDDTVVRTPAGWRVRGRRCRMDPRPEHRDLEPVDHFVQIHDRASRRAPGSPAADH